MTLPGFTPLRGPDDRIQGRANHHGLGCACTLGLAFEGLPGGSRSKERPVNCMRTWQPSIRIWQRCVSTWGHSFSLGTQRRLCNGLSEARLLMRKIQTTPSELAVLSLDLVARMMLDKR